MFYCCGNLCHPDEEIKLEPGCNHLDPLHSPPPVSRLLPAALHIAPIYITLRVYQSGALAIRSALR